MRDATSETEERRKNQEYPESRREGGGKWVRRRRRIEGRISVGVQTRVEVSLRKEKKKSRFKVDAE